jgi:glycosyltransferase involved in cell wall biosynthesis
MMGEKTAGEAEDYFHQIQQFIEANGLYEKVFILPFREDVETFYAAIDVFVMASLNETFGMVTIEALASGKTIVGSNTGGTPEILGEGEYGVLFESGNHSDLYEKLKKTVGFSKPEHKKLLAAASHFDFKQVLPQVEKVLGIG